jgi:uncharacterized membrane protein YuzA (DUF378 family)
MPRRRRTTTGWDARGDLAWKWLLRLSALGAFFYVLVGLDGNVPLGIYVLIGGMAGLPNVLNLQQMLNEKGDKEE